MTSAADQNAAEPSATESRASATSPREASPGVASSAGTPAKTSAGKASAGKAGVDGTTAETSATETSADKTTAAQASAGETSAGEVSPGGARAGKVSAGKVSAGGASADETTAAQSGAGGASGDEGSGDGASAQAGATETGPAETAGWPLAEVYDVALFDLDGVIYAGTEPIPHAAEGVAAAREVGMRTVFVTNNASRTPDEVAKLLARVGVPAQASEVATSAQAAARILRERLPQGAAVLVIGSAALRAEVTDAGLMPVDDADAEPAAVVQGYSADVGWRELAEATVAVRRGALWIATNPDWTLPSPRGPLPGNGSLVEVVAIASGQRPIVAGKPQPALHQESVERVEAHRPLVVGDRLDTDIEGANNVGCDSLLVLTGLATPAELITAPPQHRPTYLVDDLRDLATAYAGVTGTSGEWKSGGWTVTHQDNALRLTGSGHAIEALRALCTAAWATGTTDITPTDTAATAALQKLGLEEEAS